MSVREEDAPKNSSTSRGLGLAAAAIGVGVGVGAALYYFFSKRPENPDTEGSTSQWQIEQPHELQMDSPGNSYCSDSEDCLTISVHTTTDTSMVTTESDASSDNDTCDSDGEIDDDSTDADFSPNLSDLNLSSEIDTSASDSLSDGNHTDYSMSDGSDSSTHDWEIVVQDGLDPVVVRTDQSRYTRGTDLLNAIAIEINIARERSWNLEECTICYEVMLKDQELMTLPCAHNFHSACIAPWLRQQQTCPNCRNAIH